MFFTSADVKDEELKALVESKQGGWLPEHHCGVISGSSRDESSIYVRIDTTFPDNYSGQARSFVQQQIGVDHVTAVEVKVSDAGGDSHLLDDFYYAMYFYWKGFLWKGNLPLASVS
jgi:hypothetical protein